MTFAEIKTAILARLEIQAGDTAKVTQVGQTVNQDYKRLAIEERLQTAEAEIGFTADTPLVSCPATCGRVEQLRYNSTGVVLSPATAHEIAQARAIYELNGQVLNGPTRYYWDGANQLRLDYVPETTDANPGLWMIYVVRPADLSADGDEPDLLPAEYHDILVEMGVYRWGLAEEELALAQAAQAVAAELRVGLRDTIRQRSGGENNRVIRAVYG